MTYHASIDAQALHRAARQAQAKAIGDAIVRLFHWARPTAPRAAERPASWAVANRIGDR